MKDIDPDVIRRGLVGLADNIVNPKCDRCGSSVSPEDPLSGPHFCSFCTYRMDYERRRDMKEYLSQERPTRRVHVVKLPECMQKKS